MKLFIESENVDSNHFCLRVTFSNDTSVDAAVSLDRFLLNAERIGLDIRHGEVRQEPVGYEIVASKALVETRVLAPGEELSVELPFKIEIKTDKVSALLFKRATYRLNRGNDYKVSLNWGGLTSNEVKIAV